MKERKRPARRPKAAVRGERDDEGRRDEADRAGTDRDDLDVTWDQPQPRYPAPERPLDRAEERKRRA